MPSFNYPQLSSSSRSIRLVKLLASSVSSQASGGADPLPHNSIRCELLLANLDDVPCRAYEAVSYYWGEAEPTTEFTSAINAQQNRSMFLDKPPASQRDLVCCILMDGRPFQVSLILLDLLRKLHNPKKDRLLWIDFICIDQNNEDEKPRQVAIMREIFSRATYVVASLGPHHHYHYRSEPSQVRFNSMNAFLNGQQALSIVASWRKTLISKITNSEADQRVILRLLEHPWFRRIWVVQEVAMAKNLKIISGNAAINGEDLAKFPEAFMHSRSSPRLRNKMNELSPFFDYLQSSSLYKTRPELLTLLHKFRSWHASEAVDKVYALLGLASDDTSALELRIDYSIRRDPSILYKRVARYMIRRYKSLAVLTYGLTANADQNLTAEAPGLFSWLWKAIGTGQSIDNIAPSWCPDWRHEYKFEVRPEPIPPRIQSSSLGLSRSRVDESHSSELDEDSLIVFGHSVARVHDVYHNNGGVEVVLEPGFKEVEDQQKWWPWRAASEHLSRLPKPVRKDDLICLLRGSTGLAILRPRGEAYCLVLLQHSQYPLNFWVRSEEIDKSDPVLDSAVTWMDDLCRLIAKIFGTSVHFPTTSLDRISLLTDRRFYKMATTPFVLV